MLFIGHSILVFFMIIVNYTERDFSFFCQIASRIPRATPNKRINTIPPQMIAKLISCVVMSIFLSFYYFCH